MTTIDISQELSTGTWHIDPAHSSVEFVIRHLGLSNVRGRFNSFTGSMTVGSPQTASSVEMTVDLGSVDTNNADRDNHLRSTDIFNVENHPRMTFRSTAVTPAGDDYVLTGELSIAGTTRVVDFALEFGGVAVDAFGAIRSGFSASAEISRKDFGVEFNIPLEAGGVLLGDKIQIELEIQAVPSG